MKTNRSNQLARLHILLDKQGVDAETKCEMYANYGVTTAADLTDCQLLHLIARLDGLDPGPTPAGRNIGPETRHLRAQCLAIITGNPAAENPRKRGLGVPNDWAILNPFIERHAGRRLALLTDGQLIAFSKKLYCMRADGWYYRKDEEVKGKVAPILVVPVSNKIIN